ncbi:MAG: hypothetical protein WBL85_11870 [Sedimentisphaerales bacterium]
MINALIIIVVTGMLAAIVIRPKLGMVLLWPLLFMYPHYYMWQQLLPLNIGFDDLFICMMFLIVLIRRNMMTLGHFRFGYPFWSALVFIFVLLISNVNSYFMIKAGGEEILKQTLKGFITLFLVYSYLNIIDDFEDLKTLVFAFCFFSGIGAVLVILQNYFPGPMQIFVSETEVRRAWELGEKARPSGAFLNANNAAVVLGVGGLMIASTMKLPALYFRKWVRILVLIPIILGVIVTRSRSGFLCLIIPLAVMAVFGKTKRYIWLIIIGGVIIVLLAPTLTSALFERFGQHSVGEGAGFWAPIKFRFDEVVRMWNSATLRRTIFGQNAIADTALGELAPHNAYLGLPLVYGLLGTIWEIAFFVLLFVKSGQMKRSSCTAISVLGGAIRWSLLSIALYGIVGAFFESYYIRYVLFLLAVVAQSGSKFASDYEFTETIDDNLLAECYT